MQFIPGSDQIWVARLNPEDPIYDYSSLEEADYKAQELETAILRYLKSQKADLSPEHVAGKFDGYSESWTIDSFQINSLKELIDKTREAGY